MEVGKGSLEACQKVLSRRDLLLFQVRRNRLDAILLFITNYTSPFNGKQQLGNHYRVSQRTHHA